MPTPDLKNVQTLLKRLIEFDTVSRNPNRSCIDFIRDYLDGHGVASEIIDGSVEGKTCLWATVGNSDKKGIVLAGHTDVVPVDDQNWLSDPFTLTERDGKYFGRGAADMKGFIACVLDFVPEFLAAKTDSCFHVAFTCDEESDMSGAMRLTDHLVAKGVRPAWIWIGEPTGLSIVTQHKGVAAYRTRIKGVSGHSSQPDKGLNAIGLAARFIDIIDQAVAARKEKPFIPSAFDPPYTTFNLGTISGGSAENIIAEICEVLWQVRPHPGETAQTIADEITGKAQLLLDPSFAPFAPSAGIESCVYFDIPPFVADSNNPGEKTLQQALKCYDTHAVGFATEAGIFQKLGAPGVVCGPGFIEQAHQPNEYIDKNQLAACVDLLRQVLLSSSASQAA